MQIQQETVGTVVRAEGEWIWVETVRQSGCSSCSAKGACGTSVLDTLFSARTAPIKLVNEVGAQVGDQVVLSLPESALLRQSLWAYGVPLVGFFIGALLGKALFSMELLALLGAIAGMMAAWWITARFARIERPRVSKRLKGEQYEISIQ